MGTIDNSEDLIDSRDVIARIKELEEESAENWLDEDDAEELATLKALAAEGEGFADWEDGCTLIRDSYFEDYARELAEDIGAISSQAQWPLGCIDWEKAAEELQVDYSAVEFDGITYWGRS